jgi:hypothetical protein
MGCIAAGCLEALLWVLVVVLLLWKALETKAEDLQTSLASLLLKFEIPYHISTP